MVISVNKRSVMTLFSGPSDIRSHQIRIVLAEKNVQFELEHATEDNLPADLIDLNPYGTIPTLVDRDLTVYKTSIIAEYLDERFPHPPLMPVYPTGRASSRLMMQRIETDWYPLITSAVKGDEDAEASRKRLREELLSLAPVFKNAPYFMSDEFTLVDCALAPLLWRLTIGGIEINSAASSKDIRAYMQRVFNRESFMVSLSAQEREMRISY